MAVFKAVYARKAYLFTYDLHIEIAILCLFCLHFYRLCIFVNKST